MRGPGRWWAAHVDRILVQDGRAAGVLATVQRADGTSTQLTVHAPTVVVACGAIESPALLLRSGIGGPAVGKHLRLHPAAVVNGIYDEAIEAWDGQIQSEVCDHFERCEGDWGFLIESVGAMPVIHAGAIPWRDGEQHKREFARMFRHHAPFISVARDHGEGEVVLDAHGRPIVRWSLNDAVDQRVMIRANLELARLHHAAGAPEIRTLHAAELVWRADSGEPFEQFLVRIEQAPYGPGGPDHLHRPPAGLVPAGRRPAGIRGQRARGAPRRPRRVDRRRQRLPECPGGESDGLDHGPRAPHRRGDPAPLSRTARSAPVASTICARWAPGGRSWRRRSPSAR